jgi:hypothetical protein
VLLPGPIGLRAVAGTELIDRAPFLVDNILTGVAVAGITGIADAIHVAIVLILVRRFRAVVLIVGNQVAVFVRITAIAQPVGVRIRLGGIPLQRTVVDDVIDAIAVGIGRERGGGTESHDDE